MNANDPLFLKFDDWCNALGESIKEHWPFDYSIMPNVDTVSKAYQIGITPEGYAAFLAAKMYPAADLMAKLLRVTWAMDAELRKQIEATIVNFYVKKINHAEN